MSALVLAPYGLVALGLCLGALRLRPAMLGWAAVALGAVTGLAVSVLLLVAGDAASWGGALAAALPGAVFALMTVRDLLRPRINDVSTDVATPPPFTAARNAPANAGQDMAFPGKTAALIQRAYPDLRPLRLRAPPGVVLDRATRILSASPGWVVTHRDDAAGLLEAEATTRFLGFVDDVVLRAVRDGTGTRVDMRSRSREGLVDGGTNAQRIRTFLPRLCD